MGASGVLFCNRFTLDCHIVETRQYPYRVSDCWGVTQKALNNDIYLIFTICVEENYDPTDWEWKHRVEMVARKLISYGGNRSNCDINFINEPMNYVTKERYVDLINLGTDQVSDRFDTGAGNEEFKLAAAKGDMYPYILRKARFKKLYIHIQGSCLKESDCSKWTNLALNWTISHNKILDCSEANYFDVAKESGYRGLLMQLKYAEKIRCLHFPIVFIGLSNEDKYRWLSFIYNGKDRTVYGFDDNGNPKSYWQDYKRIMKKKAPIIEPIIEEEDMRLENFYYQNRPKYLIKIDPKGYGIRFLRACFGLSDSNIFDEILDAKVRQYQVDNNLLVDGKVGPETFGDMIKVEDFYKHYCWAHSLWARGL